MCMDSKGIIITVASYWNDDKTTNNNNKDNINFFLFQEKEKRKRIEQKIKEIVTSVKY